MSDEATYRPGVAEEMAALVATLHGAQERLYAARKVESSAHSQVTLAINEVNRAQSMNAAGDGTNWARARYETVAKVGA